MAQGLAGTLRQNIRFKAATCRSAWLLLGTVYLFQIVPKGYHERDRGRSRRASSPGRRLRTNVSDAPVDGLMQAIRTSPSSPRLGGGSLNIDLRRGRERGKTADQDNRGAAPKLIAFRVRVSSPPPAIRIARARGARRRGATRLRCRTRRRESYRVAPKFEATCARSRLAGRHSDISCARRS